MSRFREKNKKKVTYWNKQYFISIKKKWASQYMSYSTAVALETNFKL